jgi:hypothetical protein
MAHAKNLAHRLGMYSGGDILVNLDADNFAGAGFSEYVRGQFEVNGTGIFLWSRMIKGEGGLDRGISGRIAVSRDGFLCAGGYDEVFHTYSPDDKDFNLRLRRLGFKAQEIDRQYLKAIRHNEKMRFREYPHLRKQNTEDFFVNPERSIANAGRIGMGVVYRNFEPDPLEIGPLPSRIFGIGLHKTGTTSLHHALRILGYKSAHWKSAHWARAIWEEMKALGHSPTIENHYAVSDLPIGMMYPALDTAYPGSKFILTVRGEREWLESVKGHFDPAKNPFRDQWDHDPFSHRLHLALYGRREFEEGVFLARYRRHIAEVKEYFSNRRGDLLVMDIGSGAGWHELCGFLRAPLPDVPYPRRNVTGGEPPAAAEDTEPPPSLWTRLGEWLRRA